MTIKCFFRSRMKKQASLINCMFHREETQIYSALFTPNKHLVRTKLFCCCPFSGEIRDIVVYMYKNTKTPLCHVAPHQCYGGPAS